MVRSAMVAVAVALILPPSWPLLARVVLGLAAAVALRALEWAAVPSGLAAVDWWKTSSRGTAGRNVESYEASDR